jgi:hypothetical protein
VQNVVVCSSAAKPCLRRQSRPQFVEGEVITSTKKHADSKCSALGRDRAPDAAEIFHLKRTIGDRPTSCSTREFAHPTCLAEIVHDEP